MGTTVSRISRILTSPPFSLRPAAAEAAALGRPLPYPGLALSQRGLRSGPRQGSALSDRGLWRQFRHRSWDSWECPEHCELARRAVLHPSAAPPQWPHALASGVLTAHLESVSPFPVPGGSRDPSCALGHVPNET